jgi:hypothetical protein
MEPLQGGTVTPAGSLEYRAAAGVGRPYLAYKPGLDATQAWDPANDLFIVHMMQSPKQRVPHRAALRELVYGTLTDAKLTASK